MYKQYAKIIDVRWTPTVNVLAIKCGHCDSVFEHRADRWTVRCPTCKAQFSLNKIRDIYVKRKDAFTV